MLPNNTTVDYQTNQTDDESYIIADEIHPTIDLVVQDHIWASEKIVLIFIAIFTVLGNTIVLVATYKERSLHPPNKYFVASRAVADLLVGIFVAPSWLFRFYKTEYESQSYITAPNHLCDFFIWIDTFALTASIFTLVFISYEQYLKICKTFYNRSRMTTFTSLKIIFIIWLISSLFAAYAATYHSGSVGILFIAEVCSFAATEKFYTFAAASVFFLPITIIAIMYIRICLVAHDVKRQKIPQNGVNGELGQTWNHHKQETTFLRDLKVIRMLFVAVGLFIVCWGPYWIWILLVFNNPNFFKGDENSLSYWYSFSISRVAVFTLPLFNSLCNPIIYACLDKKYKKAFKCLFQQMFCRPCSGRRQPPDNSIELRLFNTATV